MARVEPLAVEVPGVDEVHQRVEGRHTRQEGRAVDRHPGVHRTHRDGRASCPQKSRQV